MDRMAEDREYHSAVRILLASASPRRAELLRSAGFTFEVAPADVDETPQVGEPPRDYALRVATAKAIAAAANCRPAMVVLAADTVVVVGDQILGKPADAADSKRMLSLLSGADHTVLTAVVLSKDGRQVTAVAETRVHFVPLSEAEVDWYISTGEPEGKAGAYAIQGHAARFVDWIEGSWSNVVGLPIATVYRLIKELGEVIS
jgi:septum formation protein